MRGRMGLPALLVVFVFAVPAQGQTPAVASLTFSPNAIVGGSIQGADITVTIAPAPTQTTIVTLSASPANLVGIPGSISFSPGQTEVTVTRGVVSFTVVPEATMVTISAQLNGSVSTPFTVLPLRVTFAPSPASIVGGSAETTTVTLTSNAPVIFQQTDTVDVSAEPALMTGGLVSLNIREGDTNVGTLTRAAAPVGAPTVVTFTGRIAGIVVGTGSVTVNPLHVDLAVSPASLVGGSGQTATLTVSPNAPLRSDLLPTLEASPPLVVGAPTGVAGPGSFSVSAAEVAQTTAVTITSHLVITIPTIPPQPPQVITFLVGSTQLTVLPLSCLQNPAAPECQVSPPPPPPPPAKLKLKATIAGGPSEGPVEVTAEELKTAQLPLGSSFTLEVFKDTGEPVQAFFNLGSATVDPSDLDALALFREKVVLEFDALSAGAGKSFQAVHRGEAILTIDPTEDSLPTVQVKLVVYQPGQLGGQPHEFDSRFYLLAHMHGVLPQFIKAQVARESNFNPQAWRYEPLNLLVGDLKVSRGSNLRGVEPFSFYRLVTIADELNHVDINENEKDDCTPLPDPDKRVPSLSCLGLPQGSRILPEDIDARMNSRPPLIIPVRDESGEIVMDPATGRPVTRLIQPGDVFISVRDIYVFNDKNPDGSGRQNWSDNVPASQLARRVGRLTFTAQTPLAASYGLLQMMYVIAIKELEWPGTPAGQNPNFLFDTEDHNGAGGGSLGLGVMKLRNDYRRVNGTNAIAGSELSAGDVLKEFFRKAYRRYNRKAGYAEDIVDTRAPTHLPLPDPDRPIFPLSNGG